MIDELEMYLAEESIVHVVKEKERKPKLFHSLEYWKTKADKCPLLSKHATIELGAPASSGNTGRVFSTATDILSAKRNRLKPDMFESLLFIKRNSAANEM